ncbi:MAG: flippase-like domain-containing protein, partial [Candidatus Sumerlaeia bacterium]|nr:flippase-like domain-containing protein [Candidatus Sumerlaeia bacterium]
LIVGFAFNGIFPARAGEFARAYLGARREKISFSTMLATIVVERIFDGLTIFVLFALGLMFLPPFNPDICKKWDYAVHLNGLLLTVVLGSIIVGLLLLLVSLLKSARQLVKNSVTNVPSQKKGAGLITKLALKLGARSKPKKFKVAVVGVIFVLLCVLFLLFTGSIFDKEKVYFAWEKSYLINCETLQRISKKTTFVLLVFLLFLIGLLINRTRRVAQKILLNLPLVPATIKERCNQILERFAEGLGALQSGKVLFWVIIYSLVVWLSVAGSLQIMSLGFKDITMNFWQATLIMIIICITISIPSAPGYWGLYEIGCVLAMSLLGIQQKIEISLSYSLVIHAGQMFPIIAVGLYYALKEHISYQAMQQQLENNEE